MEDTDFLIPLKDLTPSDECRWDVRKEFFESFGNTEITDVSVMTVSVRAVKSGPCVRVDGEASGKVHMLCDRCLEDMELNVDVEFSLLCGAERDLDDARQVREGQQGDEQGYHFDGSGRMCIGTQDSPEEIVLPEGATEIDLSQAVYDCICLSLPMKRVHEDGQCNPEALRRLAGAQADEGTGSDESPFAGLMGLFGDDTGTDPTVSK